MLRVAEANGQPVSQPKKTKPLSIPSHREGCVCSGRLAKVMCEKIRNRHARQAAEETDSIRRDDGLL